MLLVMMWQECVTAKKIKRAKENFMAKLKFLKIIVIGVVTIMLMGCITTTHSARNCPNLNCYFWSGGRESCSRSACRVNQTPHSPYARPLCNCF